MVRMAESESEMGTRSIKILEDVSVDDVPFADTTIPKIRALSPSHSMKKAVRPSYARATNYPRPRHNTLEIDIFGKHKTRRDSQIDPDSSPLISVNPVDRTHVNSNSGSTKAHAAHSFHLFQNKHPYQADRISVIGPSDNENFELGALPEPCYNPQLLTTDKATPTERRAGYYARSHSMCSAVSERRPSLMTQQSWQSTQQSHDVPTLKTSTSMIIQRPPPEVPVCNNRPWAWRDLAANGGGGMQRKLVDTAPPNHSTQLSTRGSLRPSLKNSTSLPIDPGVTRTMRLKLRPSVFLDG